MVAGQEQWCSSCLGPQVALLGLGVPIFRTLTAFPVLLKSQWEVPTVTLAWLPEVALER